MVTQQLAGILNVVDRLNVLVNLKGAHGDLAFLVFVQDMKIRQFSNHQLLCDRIYEKRICILPDLLCFFHLCQLGTHTFESGSEHT